MCLLLLILSYSYFRLTQKFVHVESFEWTQFLPFTVLAGMYITNEESFVNCLLMFMWIIVIGSICFGWIGLNAAHHHPDIFHDGDATR